MHVQQNVLLDLPHANINLNQALRFLLLNVTFYFNVENLQN